MDLGRHREGVLDAGWHPTVDGIEVVLLGRQLDYLASTSRLVLRCNGMPNDAAVVTAFNHVDWVDGLDATSYDPAVTRRLVMAGVPRAEVAGLRSAVRQEVRKLPSVGEIAESLAFYDELSAPPDARLRTASWEHQRDEQNAVRRTIRDFLQGRTFVIEDETDTTISCPLFTLSGARESRLESQGVASRG